MSENLWLVLIAIFGSTGFWAFISALVQEKRKKKSVEDQAIMALLHDRIYVLCAEYIKRGYITADEHNNLEYLYSPYVAKGGNGTAKRLKEAVDELDIIN